MHTAAHRSHSSVSNERPFARLYPGPGEAVNTPLGLPVKARGVRAAPCQQDRECLYLPAMTRSDDSNERPMGALSGAQVVEWGTGRASAYAGRLLRGLGARVVLVEQDGIAREQAYPLAPGPARDREVAALTRFLHGGKLSATLDPSTPVGRADLLALFRSADIVVIEQAVRAIEAAGLSPEAISTACPDTVVVACTLGGLTTEGRGLRHSDLVAHAMGGIAYATPGRVPNPATYAPLKPGGYQADYTMGLAAASASLLGLQLRRRTGKGQLFDVSALGIIASYVRMDIAFRTYEAGEALTVSGTNRQSATGREPTLWGLVPCRDGFFAFQASEQYQWEGLMRAMGDPEWSKEPRFQDPSERALLWDEIEPHFLAWSRDHDKAEIFHAAQANHVPVFPCYNVEELLHDAQQEARGFFVELPVEGDHAVIRVPGAIIHLEKTPLQHLEPAPGPGQHTEEILASLRTEVSQ